MRSVWKDILAVCLVACAAFGAWGIFAADAVDAQAETANTFVDEFEQELLRRQKYCEEHLAKHNDFPHPYLVGEFEENGEVTITGLKYADVYWDGNDLYQVVKWVSDVVIPDEVDGHPVTMIAPGAFAYCWEFCDAYGHFEFETKPENAGDKHFLQTLVIGDNVREIGRGAFLSAGIESVKFGKNVEIIWDFAFADCSRIWEIQSWGEKLREIHAFAFSDYTGSYYLTYKDWSVPPLPKTVMRIDCAAFSTPAKKHLTILNKEIVFDSRHPYSGQSLGALGEYNSCGSISCYAGSTAEANAKQFGYTYCLIDGESLLFDGKAVEGNVLRLEHGMTEAELLPRLASDGEECEVRLGGLRNGKVVNGSTVTLWNTAVDAEGKVYTVEKNPEVESVAVASLPHKTSYAYKEAFDPDGLTLAVTYDDGTTAAVSDGYTLHGADSLIVGKNTVTAEYGTQTASFDVMVKYTWWQTFIRIFLFGWLWY